MLRAKPNPPAFIKDLLSLKSLPQMLDFVKNLCNDYKSRSDAEGHLLLLHQRVPNIEFKVVFDLPDGYARRRHRKN